MIKILQFVMIGKMMCVDQAFIDIIENAGVTLPQIEWKEELPQEALDLYYENIDVLKCASGDDPMPIVVSQAMMHERSCIVADHRENLSAIGKRAREIIENNLIYLNSLHLTCELILVNDIPKEQIDAENLSKKGFSLKVLNSGENRGFTEHVFMVWNIRRRVDCVS